MADVSVAEAKNRLTRLLHEVEQGEAVHITRHGKPVAVLISEAEYTQMAELKKGVGFMEFVDQWRAAMVADGLALMHEDELEGLRDNEAGRDFKWAD